jgi:hypothetical protein
MKCDARTIANGTAHRGPAISVASVPLLLRTGAASGSEGSGGDKLAVGTGRAVGLALSLRERVMQLEKRNRCAVVEVEGRP